MNSELQCKTLGVYGVTEKDFFDKLINKNVDTFIDIRKRRGVRGAKYSFVNSTRLQNKLNELNIRYLHELDLAPTNAIRDLQKEADKIQGILKRERNCLGPEFINAYRKEILGVYNFEKLLQGLRASNTNIFAFFCVEAESEACHRLIVANHLLKHFSITHEGI